VQTYNQILSKYLEASAGLQGAAASAAFRTLLANEKRALYRTLTGKNGSKFGIQAFISLLFPTAKCPSCGNGFEPTFRHMHCSNRCYNLDVRGVEHHTQTQVVAKKREATNLARYGVTNVSQSASVKARKVATCQSNNGVDYPQQSKVVRSKSVASLIANYGVDNPMRSETLKMAAQATNMTRRGVSNISQDPVVKAEKAKTNLTRYGVANPSKRELVKQLKAETTFRNHGVGNPFQSDEINQRVSDERFTRTGFRNPSENPEVRAKARTTSLARYGVEYPFQAESVKAKTRATNIRRRGVPYPLQDLEVLQKVFKSQHRIKEMVYAGKRFRFQGWEDTVIRKLVDRYGKHDVITQFDGKYPSGVFKDSGTFPDLWIPSKEMFVEVKSRWTLLGKSEVLRLNRKKAAALEASGHLCRWVVVLDKTKDCIVLPKGWHTMPISKLNKLVKERR
jgi:hypothetical protein